MTWRPPATPRGRGWTAALVPIGALLIAGAVLVGFGQPDPVQRNSGVSVPVRSASQTPAAPPSLLVLGADSLSVAGPGGLATVPDAAIPGATGPIESLLQVTATMSAAMVGFADGPHAVLMEGSRFASDLGPADRVAPGAQPAAVAVQRGSVVTRYTSAGAQIGPSVALPAGMSLAADSARGVIASTVVGVLPAVGVGEADQRSRVLAASTFSAIQSGDMWVPIGAFQPMAAHGNAVLLWNPLARVLQLLDLRTLWAVPAVPPEALPVPAPEPAPSSAPMSASAPMSSSMAAPSAGPSAEPEAPESSSADAPAPIAYPSLPGLDLTGPATFSPDGRRISIAGQVGSRPRLAVGSVPPTLIRGETDLPALEVIILGGELPPGTSQPTPVWSGELLIAARTDATVALYSASTGTAVSHELDGGGGPDEQLAPDPPSTVSDTPSPVQAPAEPPVRGLGPA